jgi:hypothetical protein
VAAATHRVVPEEPVVPVEVCPESEDLAPAGWAAGVDGSGGEHGETIPVSCPKSALVPRGDRQ